MQPTAVVEANTITMVQTQETTMRTASANPTANAVAPAVPKAAPPTAHRATSARGLLYPTTSPEIPNRMAYLANSGLDV